MGVEWTLDSNEQLECLLFIGRQPLPIDRTK